MNLSQLRFASAVAATGSFTAAAAQCCVTQPTLSNGVAQLEAELGSRLFVRTTRKVTLTAFGAHLLPHITSLLSAQQQLHAQAQAFLQPEQRSIRIGTSPLVSAQLLGLLIEPFRARYPSIDVVLHQLNMQDLERLLGEGQLDFAFAMADGQKGPWIATTLYDEPLRYVPRGATWPGGAPPRSVRFHDIADELFVMVPDSCGLSRATRALFRRHRRKLREYPGEAMSYQVLEEWAALGLGAAILPGSMLATSASRASCPITDKSDRLVSIKFEARWPRAALSAHLSAFADHLRGTVVSEAGRAAPAATRR
jgi:LysR family transcriptional regulator, hydrogen peroxide-inducible genes activator